jgi:hypothetical protein
MTHSTQIMKRFAFGMIFAVCLIAAPDAHCQEIRSLTQSPVAEMPQEVRRGWMNSDSITTEVYRVGVGGGVIRGDASGGAYAPVFSSFFAFPLGKLQVHSQSSRLHFALHQLVYTYRNLCSKVRGFYSWAILNFLYSDRSHFPKACYP